MANSNHTALIEQLKSVSYERSDSNNCLITFHGIKQVSIGCQTCPFGGA